MALDSHLDVGAGDELTSIHINKQWRMLITEALQEYFYQDDSELALDNDDLLSLFIEDLRDVDMPALKTTTYQANLASDKSTTSTSFITVVNSEILHTPSYSKMRVKTLISGRNNTGGSALLARIVVDDTAGNEGNEGRILSTNNVALELSEIFDVEIGVEVEIALEFRASSNQATVDSAAFVVWQILEYDE